MIDDEIEQYLMETQEEDEYQEIMIEGMDLLENEIFNKETRLKKSMPKQKNLNTTLNEYEIISIDDSLISVEMNEDLITISSENDEIIQMTENEKNKVKATVRVNNINESDIVKWQESNKTSMDNIKRKTKNNQYDMIKRIINGIIRMRRKGVKYKGDDSVGTLRKIVEESDDENEVKLGNSKRKETHMSLPTLTGNDNENDIY